MLAQLRRIAIVLLAVGLCAFSGVTQPPPPVLTAGAGISVTGTALAPVVTNTSAYATTPSPLPVANGGTGTATPALVAGTGISLTGAWPANTITNTSNYATTAIPLPVANGGTGTATPALASGDGITLTGSWPANTIASSHSLTAPTAATVPLTINGASAQTADLLDLKNSAGTVIAGINSAGAISALGSPLSIALGGTGTATPALVAGTGISLTGAWPGNTITNTSAFATTPSPLPTANGGTGFAFFPRASVPVNTASVATTFGTTSTTVQSVTTTAPPTASNYILHWTVSIAWHCTAQSAVEFETLIGAPVNADCFKNIPSGNVGTAVGNNVVDLACQSTTALTAAQTIKVNAIVAAASGCTTDLSPQLGTGKSNVTYTWIPVP